LAILGVLVILMMELLLTWALLTMLIAGLLLYQFTKTVSSALLFCAQQPRHFFGRSKSHWRINHKARGLTQELAITQSVSTRFK
jgi:hypothetical protein